MSGSQLTAIGSKVTIELFEIKRPLAGSLEFAPTEPDRCPPGSSLRNTKPANVSTARSA